MSDTNGKNKGRMQKSEVRSPNSERKAPKPKPKVAAKPKDERPKPKVVAKPKKEHSVIGIPPSESKDQSQIEHPTPEIKMEVHHHPEVEKKTFKEYLLEGLMIFIAVMMGFFAENIRENITNNEHARQLTSQLVQDLKTDTARLNGIYQAQTDVLKANDSLFILLKQPLAKADLNKIQQLIIKSHNLWPFHPTGGASGAIKQELHLKQFSESKIISYIAAYESNIELIHTVQDIYLQYQRSMLDPFLRQHFTPDNLYAAFNKTPLPEVQMRNLTQVDLTQLRSDIVLIRVVSNELVEDNRHLKDNAVQLLEYVNKQFDLKEE